MRTIVRLFVLFALMTAWCETRAAQDPLGIEAALKPASIAQLQLSPDGRFLVALGRAQSKVGVLLIDADSLDSKVILSAEGALSVRWVGNDAALPQHINWLSDRAAQRVLVSSYCDVDPGQWYLLNTGQMSLRKVAAAKPEIDPARMLPKRVVSYASDDGLEIPAYLTLPRDSHGPVPGSVFIHGGPVARDHWRWDGEVQLLASRGYAVLQPLFRGSSGFGKKFETAGYAQGDWRCRTM